MTNINAGRAPSKAAGFSLHLNGAHVADLIQFACQNRTESAFQLTSPQGQAQLYFGSGELLHAQCAGKTGLSAVVEILQWQEGEAKAMEEVTAPEESIGMEASALLLRAAQRQDEQANESLTAPVNHAASEPTTCVVRKCDPPPASLSSSAEPKVVVRPPPLPTLPPMGADSFRSTWAMGIHALPPPPRLPKFELSAERFHKPPAPNLPLQIVKLSSSGLVERRTGGADQDMVDRVFCASRIVASMGNKLGLGTCRALHLRGEGFSLIVCGTEAISGVEGRCEALYPIAQKLKVL